MFDALIDPLELVIVLAIIAIIVAVGRWRSVGEQPRPMEEQEESEVISQK